MQTITKNWNTTLKIYTPIVLLGILSLIAFSPMLTAGWFYSHENAAPIERILALSYEMKNGDFYPRWLSSAYRSQGLPFFNFYSPMFYLPTAYLHSFGLPLLFSIKLVIWMLFFFGSVGMFLWVRKHCGIAGGLISAIIYLFLPYHFLDIYVRGAMAEFAALAVLPFLFYGIDRSFSERTFSGILITGISSALLVLTHNLSALMIVPFATCYFFSIAVFERASRKKLFAAFAGPIVGLGLSAFYWLPVAMEKKYLGNFTDLISGYYNYADHFISPPQWFSSYWGFGGSVLGVGDEMGFQIGYVLLLFLIVSLGCLVFSKEMRRFGIVTLFLGLVGLFMTSASSSAIYEIFSPLQFVQFPWRFLGSATLFLSAFAGLAIGLSHKFKALQAVYLILFCLFLSVVLSGEQRAVSGMTQLKKDIENADVFKDRLIWHLSGVDEYLPKWAKGKAEIYPSLLPQSLSNTTRVEEITVKGFYTSFIVNGETGSDIRIPQFFFPGWRAQVDGVDTAVWPGRTGLLFIKVPSGRHTVEVWFGTTNSRLWGWAIAIFTIVVLVVVMALRCSSSIQFRNKTL